jgi:hypothetical protein
MIRCVPTLSSRIYVIIILMIVCAFFAPAESDASDKQSSPVLFYHESADEPQLGRLLNEFDYDAYISAGATEFEQMALLKDWVYSQIPYELNYTDSELRDSIQILSRARRGDSFLCANKATVYMQCSVSKGWTSRYILLKKSISDEHAGNDIWSNKYRKWIYIDATWNIHVEKNSIPLSIHEIRSEWLKNKGKLLVYVFGAGQNEKRYRLKDLPVVRRDSKIWQYLPIDRTWLDYTHEIAVLGRNDFFSCCGRQESKIWGPIYQLQRKKDLKGRIKDFFIKEKRYPLKALFYDLNRVDITITQTNSKQHEWHPGKADVSLDAFGTNNYTPNFMEFLVKINKSDWMVERDSFQINLVPGNNVVRARIMNKFGVVGPVTIKRIKIDMK